MITGDDIGCVINLIRGAMFEAKCRWAMAERSERGFECDPPQDKYAARGGVAAEFVQQKWTTIVDFRAYRLVLRWQAAHGVGDATIDEAQPIVWVGRKFALTPAMF